jgi:hypothetical protein
MTIKSFMDIVKDNQKQAMESKQAMAMPEVGIFWVYQGKVCGTSKSLSDADWMGDYKYDKTTHYFFWEVMLSREEYLPKDKEFNEVPRGRVVYVVSEKAYHIISNAEVLGDSVVVERIKAFFNIRPEFKVVLEVEEQYTIGFNG